MADFLDWPQKCKELAVSESVLRSQALVGEVDCFIFLRDYARGSQDVFLPPYEWEPDGVIRWRDLGTPYDPSDIYEHGTREFAFKNRGQRHRFPDPRYHINGYVRVSPGFVAEVITKRVRVSLEGWGVLVPTPTGEVLVIVVGEQKYDHELGNYTACQDVGIEDLMFKPESIVMQPTAQLDPRKEKTYLRIIRALDVIAGLPQRGAASSVERQLQELGFHGPNDDTIRKIIEEARMLEPGKEQKPN